MMKTTTTLFRLGSSLCCLCLLAAATAPQQTPPNHPPLPGGVPGGVPGGLPSGHPTPTQTPAGHPPVPGQTEEMVLSPDWPIGKPEDVKSVDALIKAYYATVSGPKGEARDWNRLRSLMLPETRFFSTRLAGDRQLPITLTIDQYIEVNQKYFEKGGYYEREVNRKTDVFNTIGQVFSTYESRRHVDAPEPYSRGLNSFQVIFDGERWWITSILWAAETPANPIPPELLGSSPVPTPAR